MRNPSNQCLAVLAAEHGGARRDASVALGYAIFLSLFNYDLGAGIYRLIGALSAAAAVGITPRSWRSWR